MSGHTSGDGVTEVAPWLVESWQRCLMNGQRPGDAVAFNAVSVGDVQAASHASHDLITAAKPIITQLLNAVADTRYFAVLTDAQGVVVDVNGPSIKHDKRAQNIARVGIDLSERAVGTTAIGGALKELQPVWLHQSEHFFECTQMYSCAGAPLIGPDGACVGMLDITGIDTPEHMALRHLVTHSAQRIENSLTLQRSHQLLVRLNWPGQQTGQDGDGLVCLDTDGFVTGANVAARNMLGYTQHGAAPHASDLFATPFEWLYDLANHSHGHTLETVPTWGGLRLSVASSRAIQSARHLPSHASSAHTATAASLRDIEAAVIRKAIDDARGNVAAAAKQLGISRATLYRRLGQSRGKSNASDTPGDEIR
jgi:sigma-54 dependent transcriptional regulator, acetoin dehydrogenase operon transcriptional activator AcoR